MYLPIVCASSILVVRRGVSKVCCSFYSRRRAELDLCRRNGPLETTFEEMLSQLLHCPLGGHELARKPFYAIFMHTYTSPYATRVSDVELNWPAYIRSSPFASHYANFY